jgi:hypothetical protein
MFGLFKNKNNSNKEAIVSLAESSLREEKKNKSNNDNEANEIEEDDENEDIFDIDILKFAEEIWEIYIYSIRNNIKLEDRSNLPEQTLNLNEVQMLIDIIGIKKNIMEIKLNIAILAQRKPTEYTSTTNMTHNNFLDIVESFRNYRIDDKLLVRVFQELEKNGDGKLDLQNLMNSNQQLGLNMSKNDLLDILNYFNDEFNPNASLSFENFTELYYQG